MIVAVMYRRKMWQLDGHYKCKNTEFYAALSVVALYL